MSTFRDLGVRKDFINSLKELKIKNPTDIQEKTIPVLLKSDTDFVGLAQTGTGKTAAFGLPILNTIDASKAEVQGLIIAPTRELATQVESEIKKLGKYTAVKSTCVYGGTAYEGQIRALRKEKPQIVVGTPGRVIDLLKKNILKLDKADFCVLDEADEMLNMGFFEDVQLVLEKFRASRELIMFSATMPKPIVKMINNSFNNPLMVQIEKKSDW